MMKGSQFLAILVFVLLLLIPLAIGQDSAEAIEPYDMSLVNPAAHISYPPPVYVVRDSVDVRGTVTLENMRNFFVEFRALALGGMAMMDEDEAGEMEGTSEMEMAEERPWLPAIFPRIEAVEDDVFGTWNTVTLPDGLYELRLTINTAEGETEHFRVSPIRVENNPPEFLMMAEEPMAAEEEPMAAEDEPMAAEDEPMAVEEEPMAEEPSTTPRVIATYNSNVRAGDTTSYSVIGYLLEGTSADIVGISSRNTGWFYIEMASGRRGFISPTVVRSEGDLNNLPRVNPPPLPPTPIPLPTAVPTPVQPAQPIQPATGANLIFASVEINPHPATCGEAYEITVTVRNNGTGNAEAGGLIEVRDSRPDGLGLATTQIAYGALAAGASQTVYGHLTQWQYYNETHNINLALDINNQVIETNENDNLHATAPYVLAQGNCG